MKKIFLLLVGVVLLGAGCNSNNAQSNNPMIKNIVVSSQLETYFVDVPTGNGSICVWRYSAGSAAVPYMYTTEANTKSEKHSIKIPGIFEHASVLCVDDWDNNYYSKFESDPNPITVQPLTPQQEQELEKQMAN